MQKIIAMLIAILFCISVFPGETHDLHEMAGIFAIDARLAITEDYQSYKNSRTGDPEVRFIRASRSKSQTVLIITESDIYGLCGERIDRYIQDIETNLGYSTLFYSVSRSVPPEDIKQIILNCYNSHNIMGAVLLGSVSTAWYEIENDFNQYGYTNFPIDLFYMDLNGTWTDSDNNGIYDSHQGNVGPEIFVGRIDTSPMNAAGAEDVLFDIYLDRNHGYWTGDMDITGRLGLSYTDHDWAVWDDFRHDIQNIYGSSNYQYYIYDDGTFSRSDYLQRVGMDLYGMVQFSCHSSWNTHYMHNEPVISSNTIHNIPPESISYNLFCCSGARWTAPSSQNYGYLGGVYVYNHGSSTLFAIGSTKTGSMLGFQHYYIPLGEGKSNGEALKDWWVNYVGASHSFDEICWFYGMTIVGDPMVSLFYEPGMFINAPSDLSAEGVSLSEISISWSDNSVNETGFRIERKAGTSGNWQYLADTGADVNAYLDAGLDSQTTYCYRVRAFNSESFSEWSNEACAMPSEYDTIPVYRFFNRVRGGHLYTVSEAERDYVLQLPDWSYEGIKFYVWDTLIYGTSAVYRFFNTKTGIHFYTINENERDTVMQLAHYNYEGIKFFVKDHLDIDALPVYRFFNIVRGGHLYTVSEAERDYVMELPNWNYEGVKFYVHQNN